MITTISSSSASNSADCIGGSGAFGPIVLSTSPTESQGRLKVYANPTVGNFSIELGRIAHSVEVTLSDANGKFVRTASFLRKLIVEMPLNGLP